MIYAGHRSARHAWDSGKRAKVLVRKKKSLKVQDFSRLSEIKMGNQVIDTITFSTVYLQQV